MKKIFLSFALLIIGSIIFAQNQGIAFFSGTLEEAGKKAKIDNKRIFIDFYTDWCAPCKAVAKYVFHEEVAGKYFNSSFISMSIDAEKGIGPEIAEKFKVNSFPTFIVLDADLNILARWSGSSMKPTPAEFIKKLENQLAQGAEGVAKQMSQMEMYRNREPQNEVAKPGVEEFKGSYNEALAKSKSESKMLFIDCYTQWCGPCKLMSAQVFPDKEVGDFMNPMFVFMKLDMENGEGLELSKTFKVRAYPTYIVLNSDGVEQFRFEGYKPADQFIAAIKARIDKEKTLEVLQNKYNSGNREMDFLTEYIAALSVEKKSNEAFEAVTFYMDNLPVEEKYDVKNWKYWTNYGYYKSEKNFTFLIENQFKFKVGKKVVTDFFVDVACSNYSSIAFRFRNEMSGLSYDEKKKMLAKADEITKRVDLELNPTVIVYRAAAIAKINGDIDSMLDTYEEYANIIFNVDKQSSFLQGLILAFNNELTDNQRERLSDMVKDEKTKKLLKGFSNKSGK